MPCYQTGSREGDLELSLQEARQNAIVSTRMLCTTLQLFEESGSEEFKRLPVGIRKWWAKHKRIDAKRAAVKRAVRRLNRAR